jgi:hypothetical protein
VEAAAGVAAVAVAAVGVVEDDGLDCCSSGTSRSAAIFDVPTATRKRARGRSFNSKTC